MHLAKKLAGVQCHGYCYGISSHVSSDRTVTNKKKKPVGSDTMEVWVLDHVKIDPTMNITNYYPQDSQRLQMTKYEHNNTKVNVVCCLRQFLYDNYIFTVGSIYQRY